MAYNFSASYIGHPTITLSDYQGMVRRVLALIG